MNLHKSKVFKVLRSNNVTIKSGDSTDKVNFVSLANVGIKSKIELLRGLGYDSDGTYVLKDGKQFKDIYSGKPIKISNMAILPGSAPVIIEEDQLSLVEYMEDKQREI